METPTESIDTNGFTVDDDAVAWNAGRIENSAFVRTIYGFIAFSGITGNALVCFVLLRIPSLRTRTSQFIINLAINDLVTAVFVIPLHLFPNFPPAPSGFAGQLYCRLFISKSLLWASIVASGFSLIAVTTERYFAVVHPVRYKFYFTTRLTIIFVVACWVISLILASYHMASFAPSNGICVFVPLRSPVNSMILGVFIFMIMYALPIITNLVLQTLAIIALRKQAKSMGSGDAQAGGETGIKKDQWQLRAAAEMQKTLLIVVLVYALCWGPNHFLFLAFTFGAPIDFASQYYHFTVIIALFNSCVNPFIYVFKNKAFRRGVRQALLPGGTTVHPMGLGSGTGTGGTSDRGTGSTNV
ncbi:somatostatin receptor type 4-like [Lytechinus variegatus]|uniref:somatostatin receptor type 4-like n=1 Tax=Lytechinus variegatus TaxID=7654 RepID=UPI001BB15989|nr:somatostatin receptor type 4-like [Lytechinus variegatus]